MVKYWTPLVHLGTNIANFVLLLDLQKGAMILTVIKEVLSYIFGFCFFFKSRPHSATIEPSSCLLPKDVLIEIFLRLPPHPTCLLRQGNREFLRRFCSSHRTSVLGVFTNSTSVPRFLPIGKPPFRVATTAFSLPDLHWQVLGCRHSRVLLVSSTWKELLVWNPMNGNKHIVPAAPAADPRYNYGCVPENNAAVFCADGHSNQSEIDTCQFFIVWVFTCTQYVYACRYSSETGSWDTMSSSPVPSEVDSRPSILIRNVLYWPLKSKYILAFEMATHRLYHIECPSDTHDIYRRNVHIIITEDGGLGLAAVTKFILRLWSWETDDGGVTGWVLRKTIDLRKFLPVEMSSSPSADNQLAKRPPVRILGLVEDDDLVFIWTIIGVFAVQLGSMQFTKVFETNVCATIYPYTGFFIAGAVGSDRKDVGAE
ncbi:hypothetical protein ACP4OV_026170 [Aristida adscensionis]